MKQDTEQGPWPNLTPFEIEAGFPSNIRANLSYDLKDLFYV